ncbi:MAG: methyltransferase [Acidobacteria bacterium]|nr:methyltransferase [Acidobacteriota bacterium]
MPLIEKLVYGGDGLARVNGEVQFIPYSLPGEEWEDGKLQIASRDRIVAPCPVFTKCGGCHYQHMGYDRQLTEKVSILTETLARIGKITPPEIGTLAGEPWGYRNRIQLHYDQGKPGFHAAGSRKLVPIDGCPLGSPALERAIQVMKEMRRDPHFPRFLDEVELFSNETHTLVNVLKTARPVSRSFFDWCARLIPGATMSALKYPVAGDEFQVSHKSFFQVNRFLVDPLRQLALADAKGRTALDLYAGVGLFSLPLTRTFEQVTAVEVVRSAVTDLAINAPNAKAVQLTTEDYLAQLEEAPDFILADPPRAGLGKRAVEHLVRLKAPQIAIVSCDPATLARDLAALSPLYAIDKMTMVDLFPQTYHIETVTRLTLR